MEGNTNLSNNLSIGGSHLDSKETDVGNSSVHFKYNFIFISNCEKVETSLFSRGGTEGQIKVLAMHTYGGDMVVTVTNAGWKSSGTGTITFDTGDVCTLQYINSKWFAIGNNGSAIA